mmetsp:Transcript_22130/g.89627  ORF Transcript_22130/g.89627 Transcript_22130/m.89627 type:complete len:641 (-) Transcript_22130:168-2090(-)|eukprot:CAMPEP_0113957350 /NCGR_PEP_ID=MMETSP0011_2-20120614/2722_1 /TAXON_ID=101924 /ORGANISM="Rhodosorus marinus" /LENGTH=640 /DNA_ID=CAMNT_0000967905 /DNA_START=169 /DNA_END=2091 /DNA_ORIENTATION=+ /assembly_acc=CAM_ASM_000156
MGSVGTTWYRTTLEDVQHVKLVCSTPNARVFRGKLRIGEDDVEVAVRKPKICSEEALQRFFDELELRSGLQHENVCELLGACNEAPNYLTISPWCGGGCLFDVIHGQSVRFAFHRIVELGLQFAQSLEYLHERNIVHRDVKSANLLVNETWTKLKLSDMDLATDMDKLHRRAEENNGRALGRGPSNGRLKHMVGTLVYMAPEVLSGAPHSLAADVYAFGITMNEIASACVPYVDRQLPVPELHTVLETRFNEVTLRRAIVKDGLRPVSASNCPPEFTDIVERCWSPDPEARPSMAEVVQKLQFMLRKGDGYLNQFEGGAAINHVQKEESLDHSLMEEIMAVSDKPLRRAAWDPLVRRDKIPVAVLPGVSSTPGVRGADRMEDRELVAMNLGGMADVHAIGVYDGHGGDSCAQFVKEHMANAIMRRWNAPESTQESSLIHAYEDLDAAFLGSKPASEQSGCTALTALVAGGELFVANVGDCRAVLCSDGNAVQLSRDQTAADPGERARVEARGGCATYQGDLKQWRVNGEIAVTRSIGDRRLKPALSPIPDVHKHTITDADEFLILATDGLWDVMTSEEAVHLVKTTVKVPEMAAKRLALKALIERESQDNITVLVVYLSAANGFEELKSGNENIPEPMET